MQHGARACVHFFRKDQASPLRFDLAGSGLSPPDPTDDYTDARSKQLRNALIDKFGVTRATLLVTQWVVALHAHSLLFPGARRQAGANVARPIQRGYLKAIPRVKLVALPGIGHLPYADDPVRSLVPVRAFLRCSRYFTATDRRLQRQGLSIRLQEPMVAR